jgi:HAD superfamily hydrolase (TIGR01549 family)
VAGLRVEEEHGDELRDRWEALFDKIIDDVSAFDGAHDFIAELKRRGHPVVLASSAVEKHVDHYIDLLDARDLVDAYTTKDDVDATKPEPDLVQAALRKAGTESAVMVGDTPWDIRAARKAGLETICVLSGGFSEDELRGPGAIAVYESVKELKDGLNSTPLS